MGHDLPDRDGRAQLAAAGPLPARHRAHPADGGADRRARRRRDSGTPRRATSTSASPPIRATASSRSCRATRCCRSPTSAATCRTCRASAIPSTSCCGSGHCPMSRRGPRRGVRAARDGTSSARPWRAAYLGTRFEIHGGGGDLLFPHHESELAQAEGASGERPWVAHWTHAGMLSYERRQDEQVAREPGAGPRPAPHLSRRCHSPLPRRAALPFGGRLRRGRPGRRSRCRRPPPAGLPARRGARSRRAGPRRCRCPPPAGRGAPRTLPRGPGRRPRHAAGDARARAHWPCSPSSRDDPSLAAQAGWMVRELGARILGLRLGTVPALRATAAA